MPLDEYRARRDAARTPEPVPAWDVPVVPADHTGNDQEGRGDTFVIQEHHARALHWDVRLERDGVLVSWAVPKGLPLDPKTNHLAKQTEDHPLGYASFAGEIPKGEYGGGTVTIWDSGTYVLETWTSKEVKVVLSGSRVSGRYVFFRTGGRDWMVHRMDPPPHPEWAPLPGDLTPMLAVSGDLPTDPGWSYEFKWDGIRALCWVEGGRVRLVGRSGREVTAAYPELRSVGLALGSTQALLDGEVVALGPDGRPSFELLQTRMHAGPGAAARLASRTPATYLPFDVLHLDGRPLLRTPYAERRALLEALPLDVPPSFPGDATAATAGTTGAAVLEAARGSGLEGVVAKKVDSPYEPGRRSPCWVKVPLRCRQDCVIGGWKPGEGGRSGRIGSLLLGVQSEAGLAYAGHVGTGFTEATLRDLSARLATLRRATSPFAGEVPRMYAKDAVWVEPRLVCAVEFTHWTRDGRLRHPSYKGLRDDLDPAQVVRDA